MQCNSCGASIPAEAKHCPLCGVPVFNPGPFQESVSPPPPSPPDSNTWADSYNSRPFSEMPPPASPNPPPEWVTAAGSYNPPSPAGSPPNAYGQSAYTPYYASTQQPPYTMPQLPFPPPLQQRPPAGRSLSRGMMILLIVLALLIMSGGFGLIYYTTVAHPAQLHTEATATVQTQQTRQAQATARANTQATGTAIAVANATATAQASATAVVSATATALQGIYTSATLGTPTINDSLSGSTGSGWDQDQAQGGGGCAFTGGAYHASLFSKGFYFPCFAQNTNFSDFAFQVQMTITQGDAGGLLFRGSRSVNKFYVFRIESNGTYDLFNSEDSSHSIELAFGTSPAIHKYAGHSNLLTVIARGNNLYLFVNKQYVGSVNDGTYKSGQIGVFAEDRTNPTDVAYSNAEVWRL